VFAKPITLKFQGKDKYSTWVGKLTSFLIYVLLLSYAISRGTQILTRSNVTLSQVQTSSQNVWQADEGKVTEEQRSQIQVAYQFENSKTGEMKQIPETVGSVRVMKEEVTELSTGSKKCEDDSSDELKEATPLSCSKKVDVSSEMKIQIFVHKCARDCAIESEID